MWGRQSYRLSDIDFKANKKEGIAIDWPLRYKDIAPWYDKVEEIYWSKWRKPGIGTITRWKVLTSNGTKLC